MGTCGPTASPTPLRGAGWRTSSGPSPPTASSYREIRRGAELLFRAIQDEAGSKVPVLGYTVPFSIGNILRTAWGPVVVLLTR